MKKLWIPLVAVLAVIVAGFVFQRIVGNDDEAKIKKTIEVVAMSTDPEVCHDDMTERYLRQRTGLGPDVADDVCEEHVAANESHSVVVSDVAIDGSSATALVAESGSWFNGSELQFGLVRADGNWKLDRLIAFERFDRGAFDQGYEGQLAKYGTPRRSIDCALQRLRKSSDSEIEAALIEGTSGPMFVEILAGCDRKGAEREILEAAAAPGFTLSPSSLRCVEGKAAKLDDADLGLATYNPIDYGELVISCAHVELARQFEAQLRQEGVDPPLANCIVTAYKRFSPADAARLSYDQRLYGAVVEACETDAKAPLRSPTQLK